MKKLNLLLLGAVLFIGMSVSTLSAETTKCGGASVNTPGMKCGAKMNIPDMKKPACCEAKAPEFKKPACCEASAAGKACTCPKEVKCECEDPNNCTCGAKKQVQKGPKEAMKCGKGKCA